MSVRFLQSFVPPRQKSAANSGVIPALRGLTWLQWAQFLTGWIAWTYDALDFFSVALTVPLLAKQFDRPVTSITTAITFTLLFRSVGAIFFGVLSDRFGRKWPLVGNLLFCSSLSLGTSFVNTYSQFLAVRSLFGIAMGGVWGLASSSALESLPVELRGLGSGIVQQGYALGYLIAAVINLKLVPNTSHSWRALFWTASSVAFTIAVVRACLPESAVFLRAKAAEREKGLNLNTTEKTKVFVRETKEMLRAHWKRCIYAVLLMADLYPTYLETSKGFTAHDATIATIIGNCGAITGGALAGYSSQYVGRRLTIVICVLLVGSFIPLWILPNSFSGLAAGAFCIQFGVQGAWGVIPIQLAEMSPPAFRATFPGVAYQLGNMISSASAQIEATGGRNLRTTLIVDGQPTNVPDYATVQGIFIGVVAAFVIVVTILGPENHSSHFEEHKTAFEEGGGRDDAVMGEVEDEGRKATSIQEVVGKKSDA
ncbi:carboxylic acid transporter protein [Melanogaster broomeanus]|nr:carboxylic acid transporter protein [Melanogaster broomeanus]